MNRLKTSCSNSRSRRCLSSFVPSVGVARACVSPRVNSAEPCTRGSTPTSHVICANLVERAAIGTAAANQHIVAEDALAQSLERAIGELASYRPRRRYGRQDLGLDRVHEARSFRAWGASRCPARRAAARRIFAVICLIQRFVERRRLHLPPSSASTRRAQVPNAAMILLDLAVAELERIGDGILGNFERARFNHHDRISASPR